MDEVASSKVVNVNTASLESLRDDVVGIGPVLAGRIVSYREEHGPFASLSELTSVQGIGPRLLQRIAAQLVVGESPAPLAEAPAPGDVPGERGELGVEDVAFAPSGPGAAEPEAKQGERPGGEQGSPQPAGMAPPASAPAQPTRSHSSIWREVVLVLLGGLLGALLSLAVVLACSGTLDLAPHKEVSALSRNLGTMRSDQETAWQRINELSQRVVGLEREVEQLGVLRQRVADLERELEAVRSDTNRLAADFAALRSEVREGLESLDRRMSEMESTLQRVQERVKRFDAFLTGLRDLLNGIEGAAPTPEGNR